MELQKEKSIAESKTKLMRREIYELRYKIFYIDSVKGEADENVDKLGKLYNGE